MASTITPSNYDIGTAKSVSVKGGTSTPTPVTPPQTTAPTTVVPKPTSTADLANTMKANLANAGYTWDANGQVVSPGTKSTVTTVPSPTSTTSNVSTPAKSADQTKLDTMNQDLLNSANTFNKTISDIQSGATPLSTGEQSQVDALSNSYNDLINKQTLANTASQGIANIRGYQTGAAEYDPTFQVKTIGAIVSAGQQQLADLQTKKAGAIATLTQALKDGDIKVIKTAYDALSNAQEKNATLMQNLLKETNDAIKTANDSASQALEAKLTAIVIDPSMSLADKQKALATGMQGNILTPTQIKNLTTELDNQKTKTDNIEVDVGGRKLLIDKNTGQTVKDLGASSIGKVTQAEKLASAIARYSSAFTAGAKLKDGTPIIDDNGFITPVAWKKAAADAPAEEISRADFIKNFGYLLYTENGKVSPAYGLTNAEQKLLTGVLQ